MRGYKINRGDKWWKNTWTVIIPFFAIDPFQIKSFASSKAKQGSWPILAVIIHNQWPRFHDVFFFYFLEKNNEIWAIGCENQRPILG